MAEEEEGDHDDSSSSYNSQELNDMLSHMDIDNDFNMWTSFRSSVLVNKRDSNATESSSMNSQQEQLEIEINDVLKWKARYRRSELYSKHYHATASEQQELIELEKFLGMAPKKKPSSFGRLLGFSSEKRRSDTSQRSNTSNNTKDASSTSLGAGSSHENEESTEDDCIGPAAWDALIHPLSNLHQATSIILKRGPVLLRHEIDGTTNNTEPCTARECELILLTHGLVLAVVVEDDKKKKNKARNNSGSSGASNSSTSKSIVLRTFETALLWNAVEYVAPACSSSASLKKTNAWKIQLKTTTSTNDSSCFFLECATATSCQAWLDALETVLVRTRMHAATSSSSSSSNDKNDLTFALGWQYRLMHKSAYTLAVTNDCQPYLQSNLAMTCLQQDVDLNRCDLYSGYAPLHYAVRLNHVPAARLLLQAGANPNIATTSDGSSSEGESDHYCTCTPMYFCVRDELHDMIALLKEYGAFTSKRALLETTGALFGAVAETQTAVNEKKQLQLQAQQHQMAQNMAALERRGQTIEQLGNKASDLNEGAKTYGDLAAQLKEQSKKKTTFFGLF